MSMTEIRQRTRQQIITCYHCIKDSAEGFREHYLGRPETPQRMKRISRNLRAVLKTFCRKYNLTLREPCVVTDNERNKHASKYIHLASNRNALLLLLGEIDDGAYVQLHGTPVTPNIQTKLDINVDVLYDVFTLQSALRDCIGCRRECSLDKRVACALRNSDIILRDAYQKNFSIYRRKGTEVIRLID